MDKVTQYRQELKGRILKASIKEIKQKGIKKVKMDDIANLLAISKRTLYEIYPDKESLLFEGIKVQNNESSAEIKAFAMDPSHNVIDIFMEFYHLEMKNLSNVNPIFFIDLHKYPTIITYLQKHREERQSKSDQFFQQGVEEGYFRDDVDFNLITRIGGSTMEFFMQNKMYKEYSLEQLFRSSIIFFLRGICTTKGIEKLDKKLQ